MLSRHQRTIAGNINRILLEFDCDSFRSTYPIIKYALECAGFEASYKPTKHHSEMTEMLVTDHGGKADSDRVLSCVIGVAATITLEHARIKPADVEH